MKHNVFVLRSARTDLSNIHKYLIKTVSKQVADKVIRTLQEACDSLVENPERGSVPGELSDVAMFEYRQIVVNQDRIIYQRVNNNVFIFSVLHGVRGRRHG